jgi:hypothetical protein
VSGALSACLVRACKFVRKIQKNTCPNLATLGTLTSQAEIPALHDDDVLAFLARVGVLSAYESGELKCSICNMPLLDSGLGAARIAEGDVVFVCTKLDCLDDFHAR